MDVEEVLACDIGGSEGAEIDFIEDGLVGLMDVPEASPEAQRGKYQHNQPQPQRSGPGCGDALPLSHVGHLLLCVAVCCRGGCGLSLWWCGAPRGG